MATSWTDVNKATGTSYTDVAKPSPNTISSMASFTGGEPYGLLLALTQSTMTVSSVVSSKWTDITKADGTSWTDIAKAT